MEIDIYSKDGRLKLRAEAGSNSTQTEEIPGGRVLSLTFTLPEGVMLDVNDYADFMGQRYRLTERYRPVQKSTLEWDYTVRLYGPECLIGRFLVLNRTDGMDEPVFSLTASAREHVALIVKCINDGFGTEDWKVGAVEGAENITVDYEGTYCDAGLKAVADKVGAEYWIEGTTVNVGRCEHGERIAMGYMNGLTKVQPDVADNNKVYTRLFPVGSSRNIDPARYGASRLHLPGGRKYVDVNTDKYGVIHHYESSAFAGIYPRRTGTVSDVRSEKRKGEDGTEYEVYYFKDADLDFDPNDYDIPGLVKRVSFQEGSELAGLGNEDNGSYYLEVDFNSQTREFEIITLFNDDMQIPGGVLVPEVGDDYILWNLRMPDEYYPRAEQELLEAVREYNRVHGVDVACYKAQTDYLWVNRLGVTLHAGQRVRLESREFFPETGYKDTRITRIVRRVDNPGEMDIEMSDALSGSFMDSIQGSIEEVKAYARSSRGSLPDIIRTTDGTLPTDNNLFSARRVQRDFMSRVRDDRSSGRIASDKGFDAGNYEAGLSGATVRVLEDGTTYGELDRLYVRMKAVFESLTAVRTESLAGEQLVTPAGSLNCVEVEDCGEWWRCYFTAEIDGERIENMFEPGDQARCNYFNAAQTAGNRLANKFYWRLVTGVGPDYIDLSKADCAGGSDEPAAGDVICQLGNRTKKSRQTAIRISTVLGNPPSITLLYDIDGYSLEGKDAVSMGVDATTGRPYLRCYGDAHFGGRDGVGSLLDYDSATGLMDYRGRINLRAMVGNTSVEKIVERTDGAIVDSETLYIEHDSDTEKPAEPVLDAGGGILNYNGWKEEAPQPRKGVYIWQVIYTRRGGGEAELSDLVCVSGRDGEAAVIYSLLPSVGSVTRHADGSLSAGSVSCSVRRITGDAMAEASNDHMLTYERLPDGAAGVLPRTEGVSAGVTILADTEAVIFELRNGGVVLDRERVPVLSDVKDMALGGENLVLNAGFSSMKFIQEGFKVDRSKEGRFRGSNVLKLEMEGYGADMWSGFWQNYPENPHLLCEPEVYYSYSMWVYSPDVSTIDAGATLEMHAYRADGSQIRYIDYSIVPSKSGEWQRISGRFKTPADAHHLRFVFYLRRNGRLWVSQPQLVRGAILPDWAPSPNDFSYLAEALRQGGSIDGGLAMMAIVEVGHYDEEGRWVTMSGMNGITNPDKSNRDITYWGGGDMIDIELDDVAEEDEAAAYVLRRDGTGYFARGAISFGRDRARFDGALIVRSLDLKINRAPGYEGVEPDGSICIDTSYILLPELPEGVCRSLRVLNPGRSRMIPGDLTLIPGSPNVYISDSLYARGAVNKNVVLSGCGDNGNRFFELIGWHGYGQSDTIWLLSEMNNGYTQN